MRNLQILLFELTTVVCCLPLTGCQGNYTSYTPELDVFEAEVVTPTGAFPLVPIKSDTSNCWWPVVFVSEQAPLEIRFSALAECEVLEIGRLVPSVSRTGVEILLVSADGIELQPNLSYYQKNDEQTVALVIGSPRSSLFPIETPVALQDSKMDMHGGSLSPTSRDLIREHQDDRHRFYLAFTVDGEAHHLEVTFRIELIEASGWGAPGVP